jgi:hypothetical protein
MRAFALLLLTTPAMAQDLTLADCTAIMTAAQPTIAMLAFPLTVPPVTLQDGWCQLDDIVITPEGEYQPTWTIEAIRFRGAGLAALASGKPPTTLEVEVRKVDMKVTISDPDFEYLMAQQRGSLGIDVDIAAAYDPAARVLRLDRFDIDFPGPNFIGLTAQIDRIDLNSMDGMQSSVGWAGVTSLGLTVTSNGLFEEYFLMPVGDIVLMDRPQTIPPAAHVAGVIADSRATIADLPDTLIDAPSKAALDMLLAEMPNPWGTLTVNATAPQGFGSPRFMGFAMTGVPETLQDWLPVFNGVTVTATYLPSPKED